MDKVKAHVTDHSNAATGNASPARDPVGGTVWWIQGQDLLSCVQLSSSVDEKAAPNLHSVATSVGRLEREWSKGAGSGDKESESRLIGVGKSVTDQPNQVDRTCLAGR